MKVIKRDGRTIDFDRTKIEIAIEKANKEVRGKEKATKEEINEIISYIEDLGKKRMLVEDIQDVIEETKEIKGEIVIVVSGNKEEISYDDLSIEDHVNLYIKNGLNSKEAIKKVAEDRNIKKSEVYNIYHRGE